MHPQHMWPKSSFSQSLLIGIMATLLTASLVPRGHGDISVSIIASVSGDDVCSFQLARDRSQERNRVLEQALYRVHERVLGL